MTRHSIWFLLGKMRCDLIWLEVLFVWVSLGWLVPEFVFRPLRRLRNRNIFLCSLESFEFDSLLWSFYFYFVSKDCANYSRQFESNEVRRLDWLAPYLVTRCCRRFAIISIICFILILIDNYITNGAVDVNYTLQINDINYTMKRGSNISIHGIEKTARKWRNEWRKEEINLIRLLFMYLIFVLRWSCTQ